jgi:hypothetical protein
VRNNYEARQYKLGRQISAASYNSTGNMVAAVGSDLTIGLCKPGNQGFLKQPV